MPFDLKEVKAQPDGFVLTFTEPVDPVTAADRRATAWAGFIYKHHSIYGSSIINRLGCPVLKAVVAPDRLSVRLGSACLREGYIHEVKVKGVRSAAGEGRGIARHGLLHAESVPDGDRIIPEGQQRRTVRRPGAGGGQRRHGEAPDDLPEGTGPTGRKTRCSWSARCRA